MKNIRKLLEMIDNLYDDYDEDEIIATVLNTLSPEIEEDVELEIEKLIRMRITKQIDLCVEEYGTEYVMDQFISYLDDDEVDEDYSELEKPSIPLVDKIRAFNLPQYINCLSCNKKHSMSKMIQEAFAYHFVNAERMMNHLINCEDCEFGKPESHYLEMRCIKCKSVTWLFELKKNDKTNERNAWFIKLLSTEVGGMIVDYDHELYNVKSREYTVKIDHSSLPSDASINAMRIDAPLISKKMTECNDTMHYYLTDVGRARVLDDGPIYCSGCDSFSSHTPVNRRKRDYQDSKNECFHDYLKLLNEGRMIELICPRCDL